MKSGSKNTTVTSNFDGQEGKIWPFREWAMHPAIIIGNSRSLFTTLWGRYHVPQNAFLVVQIVDTLLFKPPPLFWRGRLSTTYDVYLEFIGKRIVDFLLLLIELFFVRHYG